MSKLAKRIEAEAARRRTLHDAVHATFARRRDSAAAMDAWRQACARFHEAYRLPFDDWLARAKAGGLSADPELKDFAITFLEVDPTYFRSGYVKERLLRRLKSADLDVRETERLAAVLVDAVRRRGRREFSGYCRLAAALQLPEVRDAARSLADNPDGRVASRARMMLRAIASAQHRRG